jgi:hypothetical protein
MPKIGIDIGTIFAWTVAHCLKMVASSAEDREFPARDDVFDCNWLSTDFIASVFLGFHRATFTHDTI